MKWRKRLQAVEPALVERALAVFKAIIERAGPDWNLDFNEIQPRLEFFFAQGVPVKVLVDKGLPAAFVEELRRAVASIREEEDRQHSLRLQVGVAQLEIKLPAPPLADPMDRQMRRRLRLVEKRLGRLLQGALQIMSAAEQDQVAEALQQWLEKQQGPLSHWFHDLAYGNCRLPEVPAPVMKDLLLAWLSGDVDNFAPVCRQC